jgi:hypothetical protein
MNTGRRGLAHIPFPLLKIIKIRLNLSLSSMVQVLELFLLLLKPLRALALPLIQPIKVFEITTRATLR